jgi:TRAP-type C4-dicarboxylate transport system permease large subunit
MNTLSNNNLLLAIPVGSISDRLFAACHVLVGRICGGLAQVDVLVGGAVREHDGSAVADAWGLD